MAKSRKRGIFLDKEKVRARAASIGITTPTIFEIHFVKRFDIPEGQQVTAPKKAWDGQKMDKRYAMKIAELLRLPDYFSLLPEESSSAWQSLIDNASYQSPFMHLKLVSDADKNLIETKGLHQTSDVDLAQISIKEDWYLELEGCYGDSFMIVFQSHEVIFQLAPFDIEGFISTIPKRMKKLRYPAKKSFSFAKEYGLGWRCCTVVKAATIPIPSKPVGSSFTLSAQELDEFALRLVQNDHQKIAIDQYEFMLVK